MSKTSFEVVILGGGVIGSSIAYSLARQGQDVLVVERSGVASEPAASWASAGGVRRQGRHPAEAQLASEAIERWHTLEQELEADLHYRQGGNLLLAESEAEAEHLATFVRQQQALGFTDVRLLDRQAVFSLVPDLNERVVAGSYSPSDGQADPIRTTRAFAAAAERFGAIYWNETTCLSLLARNKRIVGVVTGRGQIEAKTVILAAGAWSDDLAATVGIQLPIRTRALQMVLSTPYAQRIVQPVLSAVGRSLSLKQTNSGAFLLGGGWLGNPTPDRRAYTLRSASIQGNWNTACELLPPLRQQQIERSWCGLEAQTFDEIPLIGAYPEFDGLFLALGFSGHGFALAPAVGRAVADQLAGRETPELVGLHPDRVAKFDRDQLTTFIQSGTNEDVLE